MLLYYKPYRFLSVGSLVLQIRGLETAYCIDSMGKTNGGFVELGPCHRMGGNQLFRINEANQLMQYDQCLTKGPDGSKVMITHCNLNEFKEWQYFKVCCGPVLG